jgi:class 3 adenylate cyclase
MLQVRIERHRCIGSGNCITLAPTAFDWLEGEYFKAALVDPTSVDEEVLRVAVLACPTQALVLEEVAELLPWQLRSRQSVGSVRVAETFIFTDIVKSTNLIEAMGDEAWDALLRWHNDTLRAIFIAHDGREVVSTGDGFFVAFKTPEAALACAVAVQRELAEHRRVHGFAPQVRIGVHTSTVTKAGDNFTGKGVHEAARIAALAEGGEILASRQTMVPRYAVSEPRLVTLKGITEPVEIVSVQWHEPHE